MTWADGIILGILLVSGGLAFARGLVQELMSLAAWIAAAAIAIALFPSAAPFVYDIAGQGLFANLALGLILFAVIAIPFSFFAHWLTGKLRGEDTGLIDQSLGFLFGLFRGLVLVSVFYWGVLILGEGRSPAWMQNSHFKGLVEATTEALISLLPDGLERDLQPGPAEDGAAAGDGAGSAEEAPASQGYSQRDRRALDQLITTTGEEGEGEGQGEGGDGSPGTPGGAAGSG
jgi:membrane protein required for colicin V production